MSNTFFFVKSKCGFDFGRSKPNNNLCDISHLSDLCCHDTDFQIKRVILKGLSGAIYDNHRCVRLDEIRCRFVDPTLANYTVATLK